MSHLKQCLHAFNEYTVFNKTVFLFLILKKSYSKRTKIKEIYFYYVHPMLPNLFVFELCVEFLLAYYCMLALWFPAYFARQESDTDSFVPVVAHFLLLLF